jgi:hypothetical protein
MYSPPLSPPYALNLEDEGDEEGEDDAVQRERFDQPYA